jgi:hypothetical protein
MSGFFAAKSLLHLPLPFKSNPKDGSPQVKENAGVKEGQR